ncbi:MAG: lysophospholipid acyltransferase family protein [Cyanobacteria bacterium P01_E01_bin.6]
MVSRLPLLASQHLLSSVNTRINLYHAERIPHDKPFIVVSNHRSFMDPMLLMVSLNQSIRFACHQYMAQVPFLKDLVRHMGGFALEATDNHPRNRHQALFDDASHFLSNGEVVGLFPEGAQPMVHHTQPDALGAFHRGFAHLLLRSPLPTVTLLPMAIASRDESNYSGLPVRFLSWFDPSEPLFDHSGLHPLVVYHQVNVMIGHPVTIAANDKAAYKGRKGVLLSRNLTQHCHEEIRSLLTRGLSL